MNVAEPKICINEGCNNPVVSKFSHAKFCSPACERKVNYRKRAAKGYYQQWRRKNVERVNAQAQAWRSTPENKTKRKAYDNAPERVAIRRRQHLARRYGCTVEQYDILMELQNGVCAICKGPLTRAKGKLPHLDHDHVTGKIRGVLCAGCNHGLGYVEKPGWVELARNYLAKHTSI